MFGFRIKACIELPNGHPVMLLPEIDREDEDGSAAGIHKVIGAKANRGDSGDEPACRGFSGRQRN
jgi:hypothetical protein